ncbi:FAD/NAD(P)-binding protein [Polynucleobacter sp. MG-27-Goln-C1]|uniref:FAD/NAD(P)-binding protein n=1 Tax=Polynucleobacter sp. MG-27-Goln-C1 TaxID=1819726 RepID=UPI001C0DA62B|nr:FAD/NAD(P)-binding protein [Polynucleobacter sp. MG-27-Goln-C1]MBU3611465.1 FAD/NAD(P)-binding protein [Polynucleobacter sp. MG-27-Goln-C1]
MHQNSVSKFLEISDCLEVESYLYSSESITSIAIIGCGASGVATLASLIECIKNSNYQKYKINIFEKSSNFGSGLAYQYDSDDLLMNMVSSTTSIFENREADFWEWIVDRGHGIGSGQVMPGSGVSPDGYISRQFFGLYLKDRLYDAIYEAKKINVSVELVNHEVLDIKNKNQHFQVVDCAEHVSQFDYVILCTGNIDPHDIFNLKGKSQYINNPYPINRYAMSIGKNDCVGIIGGQLTAADIAVVLVQKGHVGPIHFFTRGLNHPLARCPKEKFELMHFNLENLEAIRFRQFGEISLRQALRLARKDFIRTGIQWKKFFNPAELSYEDWMLHLFSKGHMYAEWQNFAVASDAVISNYWDALDMTGKKVFMSKYHRLWMSKRVPLPVHTCLKLYSLFKTGILKHHAQLIDINFKAHSNFVASISADGSPEKSTQVECDWIINATGPARSIVGNTGSPLLKKLMKSGLIRANSFGGIQVDYETSMVKRGGDKVENFYAIGHLTSGTYYFVSSLDMVSMGAKRVARNVVNSSQQSIKPIESVKERQLGIENAN